LDKSLSSLPIDERVKIIIAEFAVFKDWEDRYKFIIDKGKELAPLPMEFQEDRYLVKGCQSKAWLGAQIESGKIELFGDSDASIVKGLIWILLTVYSKATPDEILSTKPTFFESIGLKEHLSMSRANGMASMLKQIVFYAMAFKAKADVQLNGNTN
jgi:cysteine desulfuration protein SufE